MNRRVLDRLVRIPLQRVPIRVSSHWAPPNVPASNGGTKPRGLLKHAFKDCLDPETYSNLDFNESETMERGV